MLVQQPLGNAGPAVGRLGYGAMALAGYYGPADAEAGLKTIRAALDAGMTMIDTADAYAEGQNEVLVARALAGRRGEACLASKFGIVSDPTQPASPLSTGWGFDLRINGTPAYARQALAASLRRLGGEPIDLWYLHYPDPAVPIEETVSAMAEAVAAGQVRYLGLSNVTAEQVRRAHAVHPIHAVQYEYSLWRREAEAELLPTLRKLGIALVAWSPLGSGFLTGTVQQLPPGDFRNNNPRFVGAEGTANRDRFAPLLDLALSLGMTPAQLALAWLLHQGPDIFPIPGTRQPARIAENAAAASVQLPPEVLARIDQIAPPGAAAGATLL